MAPERPDITASLLMLQKLVEEQRRNGTVQPTETNVDEAEEAGTEEDA